MPNPSSFHIDNPAKSAALNPPTLSEILLAGLKDLEPLEDSPAPPASRTSPPSPAASAARDSQTPAPAPAANPGAPESTSETDPMAQDPYVERCMQALYDAEKAACFRGKDRYESKCAGQDAFKRAMPPLNGEENIRGFIACVTQGMILDVVSTDQATKLLYAAQVAYTACRRQVAPARSPGRPCREHP